MDMLTICRDPGALPVTEAKQADVGNTSLKTFSFHVTRVVLHGFLPSARASDDVMYSPKSRKRMGRRNEPEALTVLFGFPLHPL